MLGWRGRGGGKGVGVCSDMEDRVMLRLCGKGEGDRGVGHWVRVRGEIRTFKCVSRVKLGGGGF